MPTRTRSSCLWPCAVALVVPLLGGCGSDAARGAAPGDAGTGAESGAATDSGVPDTTVCTGDPSACLFGTVRLDQFVVMPSAFKASLFRVFPTGAAVSIRSQTVAKDGTWAFAGLAAWAHYYVVVEPGFLSRTAPAKTVATRIGPLVVPNASPASVDIHVKPVQVDVVEDGSGASQQVVAASARLFDVATGGELGSGGSVSIVVGTTSTPMPWVDSASEYEVALTPPQQAQSTYQIAASPRPGTPQTTWNLVADPPQLATPPVSPASGATIPAGQDLTVTWTVPTPGDYETVDLWIKTSGSLSRVYTSAAPAAADQTSETIPAAKIAQPGSYLLMVSFTKANCPPVADGCVEATNAVNATLTVQ